MCHLCYWKAGILSKNVFILRIDDELNYIRLRNEIGNLRSSFLFASLDSALSCSPSSGSLACPKETNSVRHSPFSFVPADNTSKLSPTTVIFLTMKSNEILVIPGQLNKGSHWNCSVCNQRIKLQLVWWDHLKKMEWKWTFFSSVFLFWCTVTKKNAYICILARPTLPLQVEKKEEKKNETKNFWSEWGYSVTIILLRKE